MDFVCICESYSYYPTARTEFDVNRVGTTNLMVESRLSTWKPN